MTNDTTAAGAAGPAGAAGSSRWSRSAAAGFTAGALVGLLGGLVGLGGAEFRLPLLLTIFGFAALAAVIVNKAMSLAVVVAAIPARLTAVPITDVAEEWTALVNLLTGSLIGAWLGASWATRMSSTTLYRALAGLLVAIAVVFSAERLGALPTADLTDPVRLVSGVVAGFGIGVVAALLGVAGGELLIPALVLLYAVDTKLAGSLSLLVSLPTMLVAFFRYSRDQAFAVLTDNQRFVLAMATGSVTGSVAGGLLLGVVAEAVLVPLIAALLLYSAVKVWKHT
ncbi:MAG: sulfite exporter TauE/SafE family protein [Nocardioides sp.]